MTYSSLPVSLKALPLHLLMSQRVQFQWPLLLQWVAVCMLV